MLLVNFEPEEESPIVFLRLRKAAEKGQINIIAIAPYLSRGLEKLMLRLLQQNQVMKRKYYED